MILNNKKNVLILILVLIVLNSCFLVVLGQQNNVLSKSEDSLRSVLMWSESYISESGQVTSSFEVKDPIRGTALIG